MNSYEKYLKLTGEYGTADRIRYPLVFASGLPGAKLDEVIIFEEGQIGYVVGLKQNFVQVALLTAEPLRPGGKLTRTGEGLHVLVGPGQRGKVVTPLGNSFVPGSPLEGELTARFVDISPPPISQRRNITRQFFTGTSVVDLLVPLAAGQREAVIGDQKTGKTSYLLAAAKNHAEHGIVIYAAIGRAWSEIRRIADFVHEGTNKERVIVVASAADDIPSLITVTPYAAMTMAEYWRDAGEDVLLILHDMSTHARYYREVALLAERFPGRDSYPGDIFHAHARLLERAGNFAYGDGEKSITCLAVGETVRGDVVGYIVSNLISITDGHLLFDEVRFSEGQRPSVDVTASVTRVGRQVQSGAAKRLNLELVALLSTYEQARQFSKFGGELNRDMRAALTTSARLLNFFSQPPFMTVPFAVQLTLAMMIWQGWLNDKPDWTPAQWRDHLMQHYHANQTIHDIVDQIAAGDNLDQCLERLRQSRERLEAVCQTETLPETN